MAKFLLGDASVEVGFEHDIDSLHCGDSVHRKVCRPTGLPGPVQVSGSKHVEQRLLDDVLRDQDGPEGGCEMLGEGGLAAPWNP